MRLEDIIRIVQNNVSSALVLIAVVVFPTTILYLVLYKGMLKGKKKANVYKILICLSLIGYLFMVLGVTFFNRSAGMPGSFNGRFLSSYKEAWNSLDSSGWKFILLNILMTLPLGMILPLVDKRFRILKLTLLASFLMTFFIEVSQFLTGRGSFLVDDIFNNVLGALIGYGLMMALINLIENKKQGKLKKSLIYLTPLLLVIFIFSAVKMTYELKEFGNLPLAPIEAIKMRNVKVTLNTEIDSQDVYLNDIKYKSTNVPIYKAEMYNEASAKEFFINFLQDKISKEAVMVDSYEDMAILWVEGDPSYHMNFNYRGGSYDYHENHGSNQASRNFNGNRIMLENTLETMNVKVPKPAIFSEIDEGSFMWLVDNKVTGNSIINGAIEVDSYKNDSFKNLRNHVLEYRKVKDVSLKSKSDVYHKLKKGKFKYYSLEKIVTLEVNAINLSYMLDSKGYYQPIYIFKSKVNGQETDLLMPAL